MSKEELKKREDFSDAELTSEERQELRELLDMLRFEKRLAERRIKRFALIRAGAAWFVGVITAMYLLRDTVTHIIHFFGKIIKAISQTG